ncbi:hypothetical protein TIFTF001_045387 [Ficus carica]|uniref:Uncharacterized protein n=1 Tax=Ficus carica TaxID=3494 RepID=A0AA87ZA35_FICCA|nr:hypothetical protein TIFTF001_045387 [Ficus carica]
MNVAGDKCSHLVVVEPSTETLLVAAIDRIVSEPSAPSRLQRAPVKKETRGRKPNLKDEQQ